MMSESADWWTSLTDECPITLEPLSELPYPPFVLSSKEKKCAAAPGAQYYFDGLALATYIISQGNFANPLTRSPLTYEDCVRLDEYLHEHIYQQSREQLDSTIFGTEKISVREAFALRDSIKVKVATSNAGNEEQIRRAQVLRNEAVVALRGLFVFGHHAQGESGSNSARDVSNQPSNTQQLPPSAGGFDLNFNPNVSEIQPWGFASAEQEGLRIIDDNEAAFSAAENVAWREIQEAFPHLMGSNVDISPSIRQPQSSNSPSEILDVARQAADVTAKEEREKAELRERNRRFYFLQAVERKKKRLLQKQQLKATAAATLLKEQKAKDELQLAREEIERWREQQWECWEKVAAQQREKQQQKSTISQAAPPCVSATSDQNSATKTEHQSAAENNEALKRAAAKKKAKRQKAKGRANEKKKIENAANEEKQKALELQKKKDVSEVKCGCCGQGVLGCGFEKFGVKFCSTKCARSGPMKK